MRKLIISLTAALVCVAWASVALAVTSITGTVTIGANQSFTPSTKVGISVASTATAYGARSCHLNGTFEYGTVGGTGQTLDASKIYYQNITAQASTNTVCVPTAVTSATDIGAAANWK